MSAVPGHTQQGVYIASAGLACSLGTGAARIVDAMQRASVPPVAARAADGFDWPLHALAPSGGAWLERLSATVREVVAQCAVPAGAPWPLFVASSSLDAGYEEEGGAPAGPFAGDLQTFADAVAQALDWQGPVFTVSTACTSSVAAVLAAMDLLEAGAAEDALVLGIEFPNRFTRAGFGAMQLLSPDRARPFGAARNGLALGEAVAALHLQARPARWRIRGGANMVDGRDPTGAQHDTLVAVCNAAMDRGGVRAADIDLIKPQAAGSPANDAVEAAALKTVFGAVPPMVSFKHLVGHTVGASGAVELALLLACAQAHVWPAVGDAVDPTLGVTLGEGLPVAPRHVLAQWIGFGGGHAALVLEDCDA